MRLLGLKEIQSLESSSGDAIKKYMKEHPGVRWVDRGHRDGRIERSDGAEVFPSGPHGGWYARSPQGKVPKMHRFKIVDAAMAFADKRWPLDPS